MTLAQQLVHYFDEWEQILPPDARDALGALVEQARAGRRALMSETSPLVQAHRALLASAPAVDGDAPPGDGPIYEAVSRRADPAGHAAADAEAQAMLGNWCPECVGQGIDTDPPEPGQDDTCKACGGSGLRNVVTVTEKQFGASAWLTPEYKAAQRSANAAASRRLANVGRDQTAVPEVPESAETRMDAGSQPLSQGGPDSPEFEGIKKSVTVTEKGPWQVSEWSDGRLAIQSDDFTHDVALELTGDFASPADKHAHAEEIARRLNTINGEFYTCIGKGGKYELLGIARGAGTSRDLVELVVYRSVEGGAVFYRSVRDFTDRLQKIEDPA